MKYEDLGAFYLERCRDLATELEGSIDVDSLKLSERRVAPRKSATDVERLLPGWLPYPVDADALTEATFERPGGDAS